MVNNKASYTPIRKHSDMLYCACYSSESESKSEGRLSPPRLKMFDGGRSFDCAPLPAALPAGLPCACALFDEDLPSPNEFLPGGWVGDFVGDVDLTGAPATNTPSPYPSTFTGEPAYRPRDTVSLAPVSPAAIYYYALVVLLSGQSVEFCFERTDCSVLEAGGGDTYCCCCSVWSSADLLGAASFPWVYWD